MACLAVSAQSDNGQAKLNQAISGTELNELSAEEKNELAFYAERGYRVHESGKSGESYPLLSSALKNGVAAPDFSNLNQENFNPLMFNFGERSEHQFFLIDGTDKVVQVYEAGYCNMRYQQYKVTKENSEKRKNK